MTAEQTPCSANPDQWYTERDGRRYDDEPLLTEDEISEIVRANHPGAAADQEERLEAAEIIEAAVDEATSEAARVRLIERRQARDACFGCKVRLECLDLALKNREQYGIWGGYFPEQRRAIEREVDRRAGVAAGE